MTAGRAILAPAVALALSACGGMPAAPEATPSGAVPAVAARPALVASPASDPPAIPAGEPSGAEDGDQARAVVRRYFALIEAGKPTEAWTLWDDEGRASGMNREAFVRSFEPYASYRAEVGATGRIDAGAGQRYVTLPVRVTGTLREGGEPFALGGEVTLHRAGAIDGTTAEQRSWRLHTAALTTRPATPDKITATYRCVDGSRLSVVFDNRADTATVTRDGDAGGILKGQRPASGIWYRAEGLELRGKGRDAIFTRPEQPPVACRAS